MQNCTTVSTSLKYFNGYKIFQSLNFNQSHITKKTLSTERLFQLSWIYCQQTMT